MLPEREPDSKGQYERYTYQMNDKYISHILVYLIGSLEYSKIENRNYKNR